MESYLKPSKPNMHLQETQRILICGLLHHMRGKCLWGPHYAVPQKGPYFWITSPLQKQFKPGVAQVGPWPWQWLQLPVARWVSGGADLEVPDQTQFEDLRQQGWG